MDPNACLQRFVDAIADGDFAEARDAQSDLLGWLARGGFAPDWGGHGWTRETFESWPHNA